MKEKEDEIKKAKRSGVSRREFIAGTVGGVVVGAVVGAAAGSLGFPRTITQTTTATTTATSTTTSVTTAQPWLPAKWDYTADVVIVGYGSAGAVSAITANDAGAKVLILEKTPSLSSLGVTNNTTDVTAISGGGGNSHICGGLAWYVENPAPFAQWFYKMGFGATSMDICTAFANMVADNKNWLDSMGIQYEDYGTTLTGAEYSAFGDDGTIHGVALSDAGMGFFYSLDQLVTKQRNIPVLFNTRGSALIQNPTTKEVLGVQAQQGQGASEDQSTTVNVQAKRAVILTTGGFEFDSVMKLNYLKCGPYHFGGWQYNTGDGIKMAMAAGAGMWHMNTTSGRLSPWTPNYNIAYGQTHPNNAYIWTDRYGSRYTDEVQTTGLPSQPIPSHSTWQVVVDWNFEYGEYSRVPSMLIFDSKTFTAGPVVGAEYPKPRSETPPSGRLTNSNATTPIPTLGDGTGKQLWVQASGINSLPVQLGGTGTQGGFVGSAVGTAWSQNNQKELSAGYVISGPDIPTLAANIAAATIPGSNQGMAVPAGWNSAACMDAVSLPGGTSCPHYSAANLTAAINQWNTDCAAGKGDTVFGRTAASMAPINTPPYYAIALWPAGPNTNGGPIRNAKGQTCDPYYNPIPRLYSGGELGSVWGFLYQGGGNIAESIAYGRITGTNAAAETPWS